MAGGQADDAASSTDDAPPARQPLVNPYGTLRLQADRGRGQESLCAQAKDERGDDVRRRRLEIESVERRGEADAPTDTTTKGGAGREVSGDDEEKERGQRGRRAQSCGCEKASLFRSPFKEKWWS